MQQQLSSDTCSRVGERTHFASMRTCSCATVASSFFHPSPPPFFYPFNTLTLYRKEKRIEGRGTSFLDKVRVRRWVMLSLGCFLPVQGVKFFGASLIFTVRISNYFLLFLLCAQLLNKLGPTTTHNTSPSPSIYILSEKFPEFQLSHNCRNYLQVAKSHL